MSDSQTLTVTFSGRETGWTYHVHLFSGRVWLTVGQDYPCDLAWLFKARTREFETSAAHARSEEELMTTIERFLPADCQPMRVTLAA